MGDLRAGPGTGHPARGRGLVPNLFPGLLRDPPARSAGRSGPACRSRTGSAMSTARGGPGLSGIIRATGERFATSVRRRDGASVIEARAAAAPRGPAAPYWIGLDRDTYHARLADLQRWPTSCSAS